jgi:rRNA-processing protein FCF1
MTPRVLMDANGLMMPVECDVRVFEELDRVLGPHDRFVPRAVLDELDGLAGGRGTAGVAASVGADLARDRCRTIDHGAADADDACVELAEERACDLVMTNDRPLRDRILDVGVPVVGLRGTDTLAVTEP